MNLHHLELFYYVARHGGISRAARRMPYGIQQPAVSSQVLALEQDLAVKLFERQPFRLTPEGEKLYGFIRPFFENVEAFCHGLRNASAPILRIAASELILRDYLPTIIERMKQQHRGVRFMLRSGYQAQMERWLEEREIDLAITSLDARPAAGLRSLPIVKLPLVLLVPRSSPIKRVEQLWKQTPIAESLIRLPKDEGITRAFDRGLTKLGVDWPVAIEASSMELVTQYVANGYGIGVTLALPNLTLRRGVRVLPLEKFDPIEVAALWRPPGDALQEALCTLVATRARELWPTRND